METQEMTNPMMYSTQDTSGQPAAKSPKLGEGAMEIELGQPNPQTAATPTVKADVDDSSEEAEQRRRK
eukprot:4046938-Prorocentrum_lima.AAC.1